MDRTSAPDRLRPSVREVPFVAEFSRPGADVANLQNEAEVRIVQSSAAPIISMNAGSLSSILKLRKICE